MITERTRILIALVALVAFAAFVAISAFAVRARAERCGDEGRAWVARCAAASGIAMELEACPSAVAIVATQDLRVELSTSTNALAHVGGYAITPIGEFPDWKLEPEGRRRAFDAVVKCVEREAPRALLDPDVQAPAPAAPIATRRPLPWLFIAAVALALAACVRRPRATALAIAAVLATFLVRRWLTPFAFFHQNGQGPLWIDFAARGDAGEYGPGYGELFGFAARVRRPEQGVALLQEALAATVPLAGFVLARASSASKATRNLALVIATALAIDPVLVRVARSESYFAATASLLFLAAAVLVATDRRHRALGLVAASLFVAEAARIHPLAWVPSALVPLPLFCRPGRLRDRAVRVLIVALVIAIVAAPLVVPAMRASLASDLGGFLVGARSLLVLRGAAALALVAVVTALGLWRATRKAGSRGMVLAIVVAVAALSDILASDAAVVRAAHLHLFAPAAIAAIGSLRGRWAPLGVGALALAMIFAMRPLVVLPTDAREQAFALEWRERLPQGAEVASVDRAGKRLLSLPLVGEELPTWRRVDEHGGAHYGAGPRFYYRGSLCSTPEGAPICTAFERAHHLELIETRRLPAIASLPWAPLSPGEIDVALYRVE